MPSRKKIFLILLLTPLFIYMTSSEKEQASSPMDFIGKVINFVVLAGGLGYILYRPLRQFLEKKTLDIRKMLKESEELKKDAERKFEEARQRLAGLEEEISRMKSEAKQEGAKEKAEVKSLTEKEIERIRRLTEQEIESQIKAGIQELKEHTAELAVALAEERIKKKVSLQDHIQLIDKSIERLTELYEKSDSG